MAERVRTPRISTRLKLLGVVALLAAAAALAVHAAGAFDSLELKAIDARFHIRGTDRPKQPIVIVGITADNPNAPVAVPRGVHARLIDRLHRDGAKLIAYDVQFIGPKDRAGDRALAKAISAARPVLLATHDTDQGPVPVPADYKPASLGAAIASVGAQQDSDGIIRHMLYAPVALRSFDVRAAELITGKPVPESNFPGNMAWIDYAGPPETFRTVSFSGAAAGRLPASTFRNKIVLIGYTDPAFGDIAQTPVSSTPMAGVEIHANALETILDAFPLRSAPGWLNVLLIIVLAVAAPLLALRLASLFVLGAALLVAVLFLVAVQLAFNSGSILSVVDPLFGLVLGTAGAIASDALVERRQRKRLEDALGRLMPKPTAFFISYRRDDTRWPANSLRAALAERFGPASVFMDTATIAPGQEWPTRIEQAIRGCSVVLVLIGQRWLERDSSGRRRIDDPGDWVRLEVEAGLRQADAATVPVLVEGITMPDAAELPDALKPLARRHAIVLSAERYAQELDEFVDAIERGLIQDYASRQAPSADGVAPSAPDAGPPSPSAAPSVRLTGAAHHAHLSPEPPAWQLTGTQSQPASDDEPDRSGPPQPDPLKAPRGE